MLVGWKKDDSSLWLSESPAQTPEDRLRELADVGWLEEGRFQSLVV